MTHSSTYKGKTVFIILTDGTKFEDRFLDSKSRHIFLEKHGKIDKKTVRSFTIRRLSDVSAQSHETPNTATAQMGKHTVDPKKKGA